MADTGPLRIVDLDAKAAPAAADLLEIVDSEDTADPLASDAQGSSKKVTFANLQTAVLAGLTGAAVDALFASPPALTGNNLSDLTNAATARTNLGLGTAATHAVTDFDASGAAAAALASAGAYADAHIAGHAAPADAAGWLHDDGAGALTWSAPTKSDVGLGNVTNDAQTKASVVPNTAPTAGQVLVGNAGGTAYAPAALSGDATLSSAGALTLKNTGPGAGPYGDSTHTLALTLDNQGRVTAATANALALYDYLASLANAPVAQLNPTASATLTANTLYVINATVASAMKMPAPANKRVVGVIIAPGSTALFTLQPNNAETINFGLNTSRVMWAGESAYFYSDGTNWFVLGGCHIPMVALAKMTAGPDAGNKNFSSSTYTLVPIDTSVTDNTGLVVDTTNHRLNVQRNAPCACTGYVTFDPGNNAGGSWQANSGTEVDILNNAGAGGAVWTTAKGMVLNAAFMDVVPVASGVFQLTKGQYIALQGYAGATAGNFNGGGSGTNCGLGLAELKLW